MDKSIGKVSIHDWTGKRIVGMDMDKSIGKVSIYDWTGKRIVGMDMERSQLIGLVQRQWKKWLFGLGVSVGTAILVFLIIGRNGDLVAWTSERTPIYPSEQTKNLPLPLFLSQMPVKSLTFVNIQISNAGKVAIGRQEERWTFRIMGPSEATLMLVGEPQRSSKRLVVSPAENPAGNIVAVQVGSLEPREFFDVRLIVVNASDASTPSLHVSTSLAGLPEPILTDASPEERAGSKLDPWLWAVLFAALMCEAIADRNDPEKGPQMFREWKDWRARLVGKAVLGVFISGFVSLFLSLTIGWIAVTLWRLKILP